MPDEEQPRVRRYFSGGSSTDVDRTVLSFDDIQYQVQVKQTPCSKAHDKTIIGGVSGIFYPGVNAILGATGSGKTSLLDILARRKDPAGLHGNILVNGRPMANNFRLMSGYVPQDDIVLGTLTVRENIMYSANLRLPTSISQTEKSQMVDDVIEELGLSHVANSKVGNQLIRGISGGERKRTCIGIELVNAPRVLFLDEPTTGLDSTTARAVINLLHRLSHRGRTIIFSIHQPRYNIFKLFDRMMLLARGRVMYHGPAEEALDYFSTIGYSCEKHDNPADFFLDVINGDIAPYTDQSKLYINDQTEVTSFSNGAYNGEPEYNEVHNRKHHKQRLQRQQSTVSEISQSHAENRPSHQPGFDLNTLVTNNAAKFIESEWHTSVRGAIDPISKNFNANKEQYIKDLDKKENKIYYNVSFLTQLRYLSQRTSLNIRRNPFASFMQVGIIMFFSMFVGMIYFDLDESLSTGIQNRAGAFFFMTMNQVFLNMSALEVFLGERLMFMHENAAGFYRVSVYFTCKLLFDLIPMRVIPIMGYSTIVYFMLDLRWSVDRYFTFMLNLILTGLGGASWCFMYTSIFDIYAVCQLLTALSFVFMNVFGGFIINLEDVWVGLRWIRHLSIFRYSMNTMSILELDGIVLCETRSARNSSFEICSDTIGNEYMDIQGIDYETAWDLWQNMVCLAGLIIVPLTITYIRLRMINKYK